MSRTGRKLILLTLSLALALVARAEQAIRLDPFLSQAVKLSAPQIQSVHRGAAVASVLESRVPDEVFVFGVVYINAPAESYLRLATDLDSLRRLPSYLAVEKFSEPPVVSDLARYSIQPEDLKDLRSCKPGDCDLQLPAESMQQFRASINWGAPDAAEQASRLARQMGLQALEAYQRGGNLALGTYRDKEHPAEVGEIFTSLLSRLSTLPVYLPELNHLMREYPAGGSTATHTAGGARVSSDFYWENVDFGLKPTLRVIHRMVFRGNGTSEPVNAVALKQIYASHYFQAALDLSACVRDQDRPERPGFYLITVKASHQAGLTGLRGSIIRRAAVSKTRNSLVQTLTAIKQTLERQPR